MKTISKREEQILVAVWRLQANAYLLAIRRYLSEVLGMDWSVGAIHKPLIKLEAAGLIHATMGGATAKRGGRRKKIYRLSRSGLITLETLKKEHDTLWGNFPEAELTR